MMRETFLRVQAMNRQLAQLSGISNPTKPLCFETAITDIELKKLVSSLYNTGHYARAVEEAFKYVNNLVKKKAGLDPSIDGSNLMKRVLSVNNPVLKLNPCLTQSEKDEQLGYMEIYAGCMTGIRNPRAHEHELEDPPHKALQLLILADHLIERIKAANCKDT